MFITPGGGPNHYTVQATVNPQLSGTVAAPASAISGTTIQLRAIPNPGFFFSHWNFNGGVSIAENPASVALNGPLDAQATFIAGVTAAVEGDGSVLGANVPSIAGQAYSFVAQPGTDADFVGWFAAETLLTTSTNLSFVGDGYSQHVIARFIAKPVYRTLVTIDPPYAARFFWGESALDFAAHRDRVISLTAYPWAGFAWRGWQCNGELLSDPPYASFVLASNSVWRAEFEPTGIVAVVSFHSNAAQRVVVPAGTNVVLVCDLSYDGPLHHGLRWHRGDRVLSEAQRSVVLTNVKLSDTGVYRFGLEHPHGTGTKYEWASPVRLKVVKTRARSAP